MMFRHIVVFADGRAAADRALAVASELTHCGSIGPDRNDVAVICARALDAVAVAEIRSRKPDLVVTASEARGHVPRWWRPDPTEAIVAAGLSPVLQIPERGGRAEEPASLIGRRVLCLVGGSRGDDVTVAVANTMALTLHGDLVVAEAVVPPVIAPELPYGFGFDFTAAYWDPTRDLAEAEAHLQELLKRGGLTPGPHVRALARLGWIPDLIAALDRGSAGGGQGETPRPVLVLSAEYARTNSLGVSIRDMLRCWSCPVVVVPALEVARGLRRTTNPLVMSYA